jgi:hypothetical protein
MTGTGLVRSARAPLVGGAVGAGLFVAVFLIDGATRSGYDPARHPVSALSLGERGWIQIANFVVTGLLMVAFGFGVRRALRPGPAALWGPILLAVFGLGLIGSGVFVMDPMRGYPPGTGPGGPAGSWTHDVHDWLGVVVFLALPAACFVLVRRFAARPRRIGWALYSAATGLAGLVLLVVFGVAWEAAEPMAGLIQRAMIVVEWTWIAALAVDLARGADTS